VRLQLITIPFRSNMPTKRSKQPGEPSASLPPSFFNPLRPQAPHSLSDLVLSPCIWSMSPVLIFRSAAIALRCTDGVILGVERLLHSKLLVKGANRRIQSVDEHIGMATAGLLADGKHLAGRGREEAGNFRDSYNSPVTVAVRYLPFDC